EQDLILRPTAEPAPVPSTYFLADNYSGCLERPYPSSLPALDLSHHHRVVQIQRGPESEEPAPRRRRTCG
ncbi:hypothetical protein LINGRAPRIM_LOCUS129, partial [Linum grandiflorum]